MGPTRSAGISPDGPEAAGREAPSRAWKDAMRLARMLKPHAPILLLALFSMTMVAIFTSAFTLMVKPLMDDVLIQSKDSASYAVPAFIARALALFERSGIGRGSASAPVLMLLATIFFFKCLFAYLATFFMISLGQRVIFNLRNDLFSHILNQSTHFFVRQQSGRLISRVTNDVEKIQLVASEVVGDLIREGLTLIALVSVLFFWDWKLALIATTLVPFALYPLVNFGKKLRGGSMRSQQRLADIAHLLTEAITGHRVVKAFAMEDFEREKFTRATDRLFHINLRVTRLVAMSSPMMEFFGAVAGCLIIFYGNHQIQRGAMSVGQFSSFLTALLLLYAPLKRLSRLNATIQAALAAAARVFEILDTHMEIPEASDPIELGKISGTVRFDRVSFAYDHHPVLREVDFEVKRGEVLAIVGMSGAGKTTLVSLLPRFYDVTAGSVMIDDVDVRRVKLRSLRSKIGVVTQETILFHDTVANNIAYGLKKIDRAAIEEAARAAHAHDFIQAMPNGYDSMVGEKGQTMSAGQRQRIAIARVLLKNPPILILDEATSALDSESELMVQRALANLMANRTTLVIAHRLATVRRADTIIVLDDGEIKERGTHDGLLDLNGIYSKLYDLQFDDTTLDTGNHRTTYLWSRHPSTGAPAGQGSNPHRHAPVGS